MKSDTITKYVLFLSSLVILLVSAGMIFSLLGDAIPVFEKFGWKFIISTDWNPTEGKESYVITSYSIHYTKLYEELYFVQNHNKD